MSRIYNSATAPRQRPLLFRLTLSAIVLATIPGTWATAAERAARLNALSTIRANELQSHVDMLADDSLEGREAGTRGGQAAGDYLQAHFAANGLRAAGDDGGFFQHFGNGHRNILGILEGSDADLKHETILVGAHYDHVGYGSRRNSYGPIGYIHNGADDNASGTAGILETLDAFISLPEPPRRTVLFALWDAEEKGLLGSKHFVARPTVPFGKIVFAVNVDMIGRLRDREISVFGTRTGTGLRRLLSEANGDTSLRLDFTWDLRANSDHYPFYRQDIPVVMLHTGMHDDVHRPSDDAHLTNADGMQHSARLLFNLVDSLANADSVTGFRENCRRESKHDRQQLEQPLPAQTPRLGVRWQPGPVEHGVVLSEVVPGSAADRSGLKQGDRLLEFGDLAIDDAKTFRLAVLTAHSPVSVVLQREGDDSDPTELMLNLDGKPTRLGVSWREDDAEPGAVLLTRVVPGSPAAIADLKTGDRIYSVGGHEFVDSNGFLELVTTLESPIDLTVERQGCLHTATLELPPPVAVPSL